MSPDLINSYLEIQKSADLSAATVFIQLLLPVPLPYRSKDTPVLVLQGFLHRHDKYLHAVSDNTDRMRNVSVFTI